MSSRFDYVKYDRESVELQADFRDLFEALEAVIGEILTGRPAALALTALEEAYMWVGKGIRDAQIARGGDAEDVPERGE